MQLWRELRERGYPGSRKRVAQWVQKRREEPAPTTPTKYLRSEAPPDESTAARGSSPRRLVWLLLRDPEELSCAEQHALTRMRKVCRDVALSHPLAQEFVRMIRLRKAAAFEPRLGAAEASGVADLQTFASGLRREREAVEAALTLAWSSGQVEGQINKLKLIKRQMCMVERTLTCCASEFWELLDAAPLGLPLYVILLHQKRGRTGVWGAPQRPLFEVFYE